MVDVLIVGGGPAGLSAAVNVLARGRTCAVLTNDYRQNPLYRTNEVDNYLGMRGMTGSEMMEKMQAEAVEAGARFYRGRVVSLLPMGGSFTAALGTELVEGRRAILATGAGVGAALPGEAAFVGRGVSYCATCDGMLYRGRRAVVTGDAADLAEEAAFLHRIGVEVTVVTRRPWDSLPADFPADIPWLTARSLAVKGAAALEGLVADDRLIPCDVIFALREVMAPDSLVPGLRLEGRFVQVDREMRTNIPGLYAAGDCTGRPLQVAVAVGEGLIAGQAAARSLNYKDDGQ